MLFIFGCRFGAANTSGGSIRNVGKVLCIMVVVHDYGQCAKLNVALSLFIKPFTQFMAVCIDFNFSFNQISWK